MNIDDWDLTLSVMERIPDEIMKQGSAIRAASNAAFEGNTIDAPDFAVLAKGSKREN